MKQLTAFALAASLVAAPAALSAQVGANDVALGKAAFQSSTYSSGHEADKAVDGNTDGNYYNNVSTHTGFDYQGWWYVDLGGDYNIASITLWNRTDCCGGRLGNYFLSVLATGTPSPENYGAPTVWQTYQNGAIGTNATYAAGVVGRYVKVQFDHADYLQLAEVDVEGTVVNATPEPSSLALLATGFGVVLLRRRKQA